MKKLMISPWTLWILIIALAATLFFELYKAVPAPESFKGFVLPPGDSELGQKTFVDLGCVRCHTVADVEFDSALTENREVTIPLGGDVLIPKTYGQLATGVIHPSERSQDARPENGFEMPQYQKDMTVEQLTNLVHFLSEHYKTKPPDYSYYYYQYYDYGVYPRKE